MAMETAAVSIPTCDLPTAIAREQQPRALSESQKTLIEQTWKVVEDEIGLLKAGIILFKKIFEIAPHAQKMFKYFSEASMEELEENEHFRGHALQVTESVSLAVSTLDDMDELVCILKQLGAAHSPHGLQNAHYDVVGQALISTLEAGLGAEFTPDVKEAWTTFYQVISNKMKEGLNEAELASSDDA